MSHRKRGWCLIRIGLSGTSYAALIHASNGITLCTDLVDMLEIFEIVYGMSWKSRRRSWMKRGEEVEIYLPKTSEMIYIP